MAAPAVAAPQSPLSRLSSLWQVLSASLQPARPPSFRVPHLPDEVVRRICLMSQAPLPVRTQPEPFSADYSRFAQPTLAALARVSRRFNAIATPILYMEIITDNPLLLLRDVLKTKTGFSPLASRRLRLMAHCHHLHLEPRRTLIRGSKEPPSTMPQDSRSLRKIFRQHTELYKALKDLGGFEVLFPNLQTFTLSAYTGDVPRGRPTTWMPNEACHAMRDAWYDLLPTIGAAVRCNSTSRQYPLHSYQLDRLVINHVYEDPAQSGDRVQYYHAADLNYSNWLFWYNTRLVYLYIPVPDVPAEKPYTMSQLLGKKVLELLHHMLPHRNGWKDDRPRAIDIELRVNVSCFDMREVQEDEWEATIERELSRLNKLVVDWYGQKGWEGRIGGDNFVLRIMSQRLVCPACEPQPTEAPERGLDFAIDLLAPLREADRGRGDAKWREWYFGTGSFYINWLAYRPESPESWF